MRNLRRLRNDLDEVRAEAERERLGTRAMHDKFRMAHSALETLEVLYTKREAKRQKEQEENEQSSQMG